MTVHRLRRNELPRELVMDGFQPVDEVTAAYLRPLRAGRFSLDICPQQMYLSSYVEFT